VSAFSGRWDDADLSFSPDGNTIYFISNRPDDERGERHPDTDIFRMKRTGDEWSEPERVAELSSPGNEWYPNQAADGTLYFGSERRAGNLGPEGTSDLWRARWLGDRFGEPENLGPTINTDAEDIEPWISPDGTLLVFAAKGRDDSLGSYDLYTSRSCDGAWTTPQPLAGGVNTPGWEFGPRFSPDGASFYYGSNVADAPAEHTSTGASGYRELIDRLRSPRNGLFDIYAAPASALGLSASCPG
jgi:Tol biopolymer transport system component